MVLNTSRLLDHTYVLNYLTNHSHSNYINHRLIVGGKKLQQKIQKKNYSGGGDYSRGATILVYTVFTLSY